MLGCIGGAWGVVRVMHVTCGMYAQVAACTCNACVGFNRRRTCLTRPFIASIVGGSVLVTKDHMRSMTLTPRLCKTAAIAREISAGLSVPIFEGAAVALIAGSLQRGDACADLGGGAQGGGWRLHAGQESCVLWLQGQHM